MLDFLNSVSNYVTKWFGELRSRWMDVFSGRWFMLSDFMDNFYSNMRSILHDYFPDLLWYVTEVIDVAIQIFVTWWSRVANFFLNIYQKTVDFITSDYNKVHDFITSLYAKIKTFIDDWSSKLITIARDWYSNISTLVNSWYSKINTLVNSWYNSLADYVNNVANKIPNLIAFVNGTIVSWLTGAINTLKWLTSGEVINWINYIPSLMGDLIMMVVKDELLRPLSNWLTKLWFPHSPIDGE